MRARTWVVAVFCLAALLALVGGAMAGKPPGKGKPSAAPPQRDFTEAPTAHTQSEYYTVVFKDPPAASYTGGIQGLQRTKPEPGQKLDPSSRPVRAYVAHLRKTHDDYRGWLSSRAPAAELAREQVLVGNTLVYKLNGADPSLLGQGPGATRVAPSWLYRPTMTQSNNLINAPAAWSGLGGRSNAGAGIKVGIIDTGIDDTHPAFDCKGDIQHKVYASGVAGFGPDIVFDHGTHVAGTVAGCVVGSVTSGGAAIAGTWSGVAPGAALYDYNVFPGYGGGFVAFGGSAFSHDICEAIEDGVADGMDVLNMSLGGGVQGPHDLLAECVNGANDAGVVVAVAAGNSGPGDSTVESPGSAAGALTAGASTNPHFVGVPYTATPGTSGGAAYGDFPHFGDVTAPYAKTTPANGCTAIAESLTGKVAVINRGVCTFGTKVRNAAAKGAIGVLVVNNVAGDPSAMGSDGGAMPIPAAMISKTDGATFAATGSVTIDGDNPSEFITSNADIIAGFSSRGPTPFTYLIKPDVTAPGVNVLSSVFNGEYAFFQGTSMATPHLAGSAALLLAAHDSWAPEDVKSALVNTAKRPVWDHVNGTSPTGVLTRGGGREDMAAATATPLTLAPASVSFGRWTGNKPISGSVAVTVKNVSDSSQLCGVSVDGSSAVTASPSTFSVAPGATQTLTVTLNGGRSLASGDHSGDVTLSCGSTTLKAPWWTRVS